MDDDDDEPVMPATIANDPVVASEPLEQATNTIMGQPDLPPTLTLNPQLQSKKPFEI